MLLSDWALTNASMAEAQKSVVKLSARREDIAKRLVEEHKVTKVELAKSAGLSEAAVYKIFGAAAKRASSTPTE